MYFEVINQIPRSHWLNKMTVWIYYEIIRPVAAIKSLRCALFVAELNIFWLIPKYHIQSSLLYSLTWPVINTPICPSSKQSTGNVVDREWAVKLFYDA